MSLAAVAVYIPLVLSFLTQRSHRSETMTCHQQLFYRSDMAASESDTAVFSCAEQNTAPLAETFPFYAELQTDTDRGVFSNKVKLFSASQSASEEWERTYYKLNPASLLLETTEDSNNSSILTMVTRGDSEIHSPGGRFHLEYHHSDNARHAVHVPSQCNSSNSTGRLRLCAQLTTSDSLNYCGSHHLVAMEDCDQLGSKVITGLITPFYHYHMKQCKRITIE